VKLRRSNWVPKGQKVIGLFACNARIPADNQLPPSIELNRGSQFPLSGMADYANLLAGIPRSHSRLEMPGTCLATLLWTEKQQSNAVEHTKISKQKRFNLSICLSALEPSAVTIVGISGGRPGSLTRD